MADSRRQLGGFAVLALVLLRLTVGWHFFREGLEKIDRDSDSGRFHISTSFTGATKGFLSSAKGPLADFYHSLAPNGHDWQQLLAVPHQKKEPAPEASRGAAEYVPQQAWQERILADWHAILDQVTAVPGLAEAQVQRAKEAFERRQLELKEYLAGESAAIAEYQHELWRLDEWRAKPEADGAPFQEERIANKTAETSATARPWVAQVDKLGQSFLSDLGEIATPEQRADAATAKVIDGALASPKQRRLDQAALGAAVLTIGVGICLLLGLFTRLAALAGAVFLLSVIATQPPWLSTAEPTIYQTVELVGLLVLAGTGAGRWLGLDYFGWALFGKHHN